MILIEEKEEVGRHPLAWNPLYPADAGAATVVYSAVAIDFADAGAAFAVHGAVRTDRTATRAAAVIDGLGHRSRTHHQDQSHE